MGSVNKNEQHDTFDIYVNHSILHDILI